MIYSKTINQSFVRASLPLIETISIKKSIYLLFELQQTDEKYFRIHRFIFQYPFSDGHGYSCHDVVAYNIYMCHDARGGPAVTV